MPVPNPFPTQPPPSHPIPALSLFPLNDSFVPKYIHLNQRVKIGRQTNSKTVPGERNGFFDSKVLSRQHAEVWEEAGKIYIKDVKSSNGTFINGERLSPEGVESRPFELKSDDTVEFGIDIVGEDNKTIIHHKVAARVTCILTPEDAVAAATSQRRPPTLSAAPPPNSTVAGLGSMGAPAGQRAGTTRNGLTIEHILAKLQNGLMQSRETGQELGRLGEQMNEIGDSLNGNNPGPQHNYSQPIPPVRANSAPIPPIAVSSNGSSQPHSLASSQQAPSVPPSFPPPPQTASVPSPETLHTLQTQLAETQSTLASHVEKIRLLSDLAQEHELVKRDVGTLREMLASGTISVRSHHIRDAAGDDDDDARSIMTVTPDEHDGEADGEADGEHLGERHLHDEPEDELERRQQPRPRTPEPMHGYPSALRSRAGSGSDDESRAPTQSRSTKNDTASEELASRLAVLTSQLEAALTISRTLQEQQTAAQSTIKALEAKVQVLEEKVVLKSSEEPTSPEAQIDLTSQEPAVVVATKAGPSQSFHPTSILDLESVKTEWANMRAEWSTMEGRVKRVEDDLQGVVTDQERHRQEWERERQRLREKEEREQSIGLVTPPSPRSLSSDSMGKSGKRKRRARSARKERVLSDGVDVEKEEADHEESEGENQGRVVPIDDFAKGVGVKSNYLENGYGHGSGSRATSPSATLLTPGVSSSASSVRREKSSHSQPYQDTPGSSHSQQNMPITSVSTAVGVLVLSVVAVVVYHSRE